MNRKRRACVLVAVLLMVVGYAHPTTHHDGSARIRKPPTSPSYPLDSGVCNGISCNPRPPTPTNQPTPALPSDDTTSSGGSDTDSSDDTTSGDTTDNGGSTTDGGGSTTDGGGSTTDNGGSTTDGGGDTTDGTPTQPTQTATPSIANTNKPNTQTQSNPTTTATPDGVTDPDADSDPSETQQQNPDNIESFKKKYGSTFDETPICGSIPSGSSGSLGSIGVCSGGRLGRYHLHQGYMTPEILGVEFAAAHLGGMPTECLRQTEGSCTAFSNEGCLGVSIISQVLRSYTALQEAGRITETRMLTIGELKYIMHRMFTAPSSGNAGAPALGSDGTVYDYPTMVHEGGQAILEICGSGCEGRNISYTATRYPIELIKGTGTQHRIKPSDEDRPVSALSSMTLEAGMVLYTRGVNPDTNEELRHALTLNENLKISATGTFDIKDKSVSNPYYTKKNVSAATMDHDVWRKGTAIFVASINIEGTDVSLDLISMLLRYIGKVIAQGLHWIGVAIV